MTTWRDLIFGIVPLVASDAAMAQSGNMMNGGSWGGWMGGSGGYLLPILLVAVLVGVVVLVVRKK